MNLLCGNNVYSKVSVSRISPIKVLSQCFWSCTAPLEAGAFYYWTPEDYSPIARRSILT